MNTDPLQDVEKFFTEACSAWRAAQHLLLLLDEEGSHIEFFGSKKQTIYATAHWTDWVRRGIQGKNLGDCLEKAVAMKAAWEKSESELTQRAKK